MNREENEAAVPSHTRKRLTTVLQHLAAARLNSSSTCRSCAHANSCSSKADGAPCQDLEDVPVDKFLEVRKHSGDFLDDAPHVLFDASRFSETQKPLLDASMLPSECYNSVLWYNRECERVFHSSWTLVGRVDEVIEPGSYLAMDTEWGGPVAVCRGTDGQIHAFANVCCHRGAKVVPDGSGRAPKVGLVCPYHAWTYDFDGKLKWAPGMDEVHGFTESDWQLAPVRVDIFHGFIFVCVDKKAAPLLKVLGDLPDHFKPWFGPGGKAQDMVCAGRREYIVDCNWKFLMENTCETYHTAVVHKSSLGPMKSEPAAPHVGDWDAVNVPTKRSVVPLPDDFEGQQFPLPAFTNKTAFINLFPSTQVNVTWDCLWWMQILPLGPEKSHVQMGFCFPKETTKLDSFPQVFERYKHRWHVAVCEDNEISLNQQRGVRSKFRVPGRYAPLEFGTHNQNNWLVSKLVNNAVPWDAGMRVFVGDGAMWSNDDERLRQVVTDAESAASSAE